MLASRGMGRKESCNVGEEEVEDHVGPEEGVGWGGERGEVPPPEEIGSGGEDGDRSDFGGEGKRKRGGGGGGGGGRKAARGKEKPAPTATAATAAIPSFTSSYRGVTYTSATRRWRAQLKLNGTISYLGEFDTEKGAARAYDRMAVWCQLRGLVKKGPKGEGAGSFLEDLNFDYADYEGELDELGRVTQDEVVLNSRLGARTRARASSTYRGVTWVPTRRRWRAQFQHNGKTTPLGRFITAEGAARAFDRMMVWFKLHEVERNGGTHINFDYAEYEGEVEELGRMTQTEVVERLRHGVGTRGAMSSTFRGVTWVRADRRWQAQFKHNSKLTTLGQFTTEEGAARAYDRMMVWFRLHEVDRKGGTATNFAYAEYEGEVEELGRMSQTAVVDKLRRQAQAQREAASRAEGDEAGEGAGGDAGGIELSGAGQDEDGGTGEGEGDGLSLDGTPAPHPNFLRWWRLGLRG